MTRIDYARAAHDGARRLKEAGFDTPRLDADILLAHAADIDRTRLVMRGPDTVPDDTLERYESCLVRRLGHEPVAYIVGEQEFYGRSFTVTPATLIPRPETEGLVEAALTRFDDRPARVADIGTGSGCIAVTFACERLAWGIVAVDISAEALAVANGNGQRHGVADRVTFLEGDLLAPLGGSFDLIVSNPPYVADGATTVAEGVRRHEPPSALFAGADGLNVVRRLVDDAPDHLTPGGWLMIEIGDEHGEAVRGIIESARAFASVAVIPDLAGLDRIAVAQTKRK